MLSLQRAVSQWTETHSEPITANKGFLKLVFHSREDVHLSKSDIYFPSPAETTALLHMCLCQHLTLIMAGRASLTCRSFKRSSVPLSLPILSLSPNYQQDDAVFSAVFRL